MGAYVAPHTQLSLRRERLESAAGTGLLFLLPPGWQSVLVSGRIASLLSQSSDLASVSKCDAR